MRTVRGLSLLLLVFLLGCPPETPPGNTGSGKTGGPGPASQPTGGGEPTGTSTGPAPGTEPAPAGGEAASTTPWTVIPQDETKQKIYPMLQNADTWPAPAALKPVDQVPAEQRPDPDVVRVLKELVKLVVHPDLRPSDMDAAIGVDASGRTFMRLGKGKAQGTATMDIKPGGQLAPGFEPPPVFALSVEDPAEGKQDLERLAKRVKRVLASDVAAELEKRPLTASPEVNGEKGVAAMARLDREGLGQQFPLVYAFGTDKHVLVLLQEVPHHALDPKAKPTPR